MCLIVFAYDSHPRYRLILAANRDEFYSRPTAVAGYWKDAPEVLAGRDLAAGGTWLGMAKNGRFAAVTNYRDPLALAGTKSRGDLTKYFLTGRDAAEDYLRRIEIEKNDFSGFNLLVGNFGAGDESELFYFSNRGTGSAKKLLAGIYGLSNHLLDTNWHKVETSKAKLAPLLLQNSGGISPEDLFEILADKLPAQDDKLPVTGVGIKRERILSPAFIETDGYGTRSSTVLLVERSGQARFIEKTFVGEKISAADYQFRIEKQPPETASQIVGI